MEKNENKVDIDTKKTKGQIALDKFKMSSDKTPKIRVLVRKRPLSKK